MGELTKYWFLKDFNLFKKLGKSNLMSICELLEMISVKKGDVLHLKKEEKKLVYFLKSGTLKIVNSQNGHVRSVLNPGNIFGDLDIFVNGEEPKSEDQAIVLEDGLVCIITTDQMEMMVDRFGSIKNQLLKLHGFRIRKLQRNLEDLLYKDSETRITECLLDYIKEFGRERNGTFKAKNLLTHKDIAHLTNTSRQTVSNVMSRLRKNGIIDYNSKEIFRAEVSVLN